MCHIFYTLLCAGRFISTKFNKKMMNKETRNFIWGLILLLLCGSGVATHIIKLKSGMDYTLYEWTSLVCCSYGLVCGGIRLFKTID
jgi:hypothetical protein